MTRPAPDHADPIVRLKEIVAALRAPDGCPWDREQDHQSLRASLLEEAYETLGAIDRADDTHLCEELGDLLLQVVMHAQMASERGVFDLEQVAGGVADKLVRRHPHVFGDVDAADTEAVLRNWEAIKRREKGDQGSRLAGVEEALPALVRAQKIQKKAARHGFDWGDEKGAIAKLREEVAEVEAEAAAGDQEALQEEMGDLLFAAVNVARKLGCDAELGLRGAIGKFQRRFEAMEALAEQRGVAFDSLDLAGQDALWDEVKRSERAAQ